VSIQGAQLAHRVDAERQRAAAVSEPAAARGNTKVPLHGRPNAKAPRRTADCIGSTNCCVNCPQIDLPRRYEERDVHRWLL
jgi:hypothetical protein